MNKLDKASYDYRDNNKWMPCPVCKSKEVSFFAQAIDIEYHSSTQIFNYIKCHSCTAIYLDAPPIHELSKIYPKNYYAYTNNSKDSFLERIKQYFDTKLFQKILSDFSGRSLKILDIGGGSGWLLNKIKQAAPKISMETHVVDLDENAAAEAQLAGHIFYCSSIEDFASENKFDIILMFNLIEHVANPISVLTKAKGLLAKGGSIIIKTPNTDSLDCRLFRHSNWGGFHCPRHWVLFNKKGFEKLVNKTGLICKQSRYTQGAPFWSVSILGLLAKKGLIKNKPENSLINHPIRSPVIALTAVFDYLRMPFFPTSQMFFILKDKG